MSTLLGADPAASSPPLACSLGRSGGRDLQRTTEPGRIAFNVAVGDADSPRTSTSAILNLAQPRSWNGHGEDTSRGMRAKVLAIPNSLPVSWAV